MKQVGNMKLYSLEEVKDELIGKIGTPERDEHEWKAEDALHAYQIWEAIKNVWLKQKLTQEGLGERIGVQKAQISRMERWICSLFLDTASYACKIYNKYTLNIKQKSKPNHNTWHG